MRQYENPRELEKRLRHEENVLKEMIKDNSLSGETVAEQYNWVRELRDRVKLAWFDEEYDEMYREG